MKKIYSFIAIALCGMASVANAANGSVSFQLDMNSGSGTTDLLPEEIEPVTASFENGVLMISQMFYGFNPVEFTVNLENGEAVAANQVALEEDGLTFYYYGVDTKQPEIVGTLSNLGSDKSQLILQPWGAGDYYSGMGVFFMAAFYNTVFTFDFSIPGLGVQVEAPMLEIETVNGVAVTSDYGIYMDFTVSVKSENLPEGSEINVYYKGPYDSEFKAAELNDDGTYGFLLHGLATDVNYKVDIYAQAGSLVSETVAYPFKVEQTGINAINVDSSSARYFDLKGNEVKNPKQGEIYIKVNNQSAEKVLIK